MADELKVGDMAKLIYDGLRYQDGLIFAQIPTLMAVQAATITGAYVVRGTGSVFLCAALGVLVTLTILLFVRKVRDDRDWHKEILNGLLNDHPTDELRKTLTRKELKCVNEKTGAITFYGGTYVSESGFGMKGGWPYLTVVRLLQVMCWVSMAIDLLGAIALHHWKPAPLFRGIDPIFPVI